MLDGTTFKRLIPDDGPASENPENVKKVIFCTGKVYYDLTKERVQKEKQAEIAICRVEQVGCFIIYDGMLIRI